MQHKIPAVAFLILMLCFTAPATAGLVTFDLSGLGLYTSYTEAGFVFKWTGGDGQGNIPLTTDCNGGCADSGSRAIMGDYFTSSYGIHMERSDLGAFSLTSLLGAETFVLWPDISASAIRVTGTLAGGGSIVQDLVLDGVNDGALGVADFQKFFLLPAFGNVTAVDFTGLGAEGYDHAFLMDDLEVGAATSVPDPGSTLLLFGMGFAGLTAFRRWRG